MSNQKCTVASFTSPNPSARLGAVRLEADLDSLLLNAALDKVAPAVELVIDPPTASLGSIRLSAVLTCPTT